MVIRSLDPILIHLVTGTRSAGIKQAELEADHSPQSSVEVRNEWSCTSAPPVCFMARAGYISNLFLHFFIVTYVRTLKSKLKVNCRRFLLFAYQVHYNYNI